MIIINNFSGSRGSSLTNICGRGTVRIKVVDLHQIYTWNLNFLSFVYIEIQAASDWVSFKLLYGIYRVRAAACSTLSWVWFLTCFNNSIGAVPSVHKANFLSRFITNKLYVPSRISLHLRRRGRSSSCTKWQHHTARQSEDAYCSTLLVPRRMHCTKLTNAIGLTAY